MDISSRTPKGAPTGCPVCGGPMDIDPGGDYDTTCPRCGSLVWFPSQLSVPVVVIQIPGKLFDDEAIDARLGPLAYPCHVIVDLSYVELISSNLVGKLRQLHKRLASSGHRLCLVVSSSIFDLLGTMDLARDLYVFDNFEDALGYLHRASG